MLEQKIKERRQTFEEFAESIETFAREHGERGTLGVRHLQRLAAGYLPDGRPRRVQAATARLLEHMLDANIEELLAPPTESVQDIDASEARLLQRVHASSQIDNQTVGTMQEQLNGLRRLDRQLGAAVVHQEVLAKVTQVRDLLTYSVSVTAREQLATLLSEVCCLAGWQALDLGRIAESWRLYSDAFMAAKLSGAPPFIALASAGQAFVLADAGRTAHAVEIVANARNEADRKCSRLLRSWLAAAHGEVLAGNSKHASSLRAFDRADKLLPTITDSTIDPYVALDPTHLTRWRGHALAQCGDAEAVPVLNRALTDLDPMPLSLV
ncbi:MAG TPA: hypothetical protein VFW65_39900 [Pseudonocardiaceae bacterium]|nr:hypothetical protein [Pseudonocardiaceae bacterium]